MHMIRSTKVEWMDGWLNKWIQDIQRIVNVQDKSHKWLLAARAQMKTCQVNHLQKVFFYYPDRKLLGAKYIDFKAANKMKKNRPQINKNCPSSLFSFIIQAAAAQITQLNSTLLFKTITFLVKYSGTQSPPEKECKHFSTTNRSTAPLYEQCLWKRLQTIALSLTSFQDLELSSWRKGSSLLCPLAHSSGHGESSLYSRMNYWLERFPDASSFEIFIFSWMVIFMGSRITLHLDTADEIQGGNDLPKILGRNTCRPGTEFRKYSWTKCIGWIEKPVGWTLHWTGRKAPYRHWSKQSGVKLDNPFTNSGRLFRKARTRFIYFFYVSTNYYYMSTAAANSPQ